MFGFLATSNISPLLIKYGYAVYFPLTIIEGPIVTIIAAFLASLGYFNLFLVYSMAILGNLIGDTGYYFIGRWGEDKISSRKRFLGIDTEQVKKLEKHFEQHAGKTLFLGKWTHYFVIPILVAAGIAKMPYKKFIWLNFIGELPKSLAFLLVGYYFGKAYGQLDKFSNYALVAVIIIVIIVAIIYFLKKKIKKQLED